MLPYPQAPISTTELPHSALEVWTDLGRFFMSHPEREKLVGLLGRLVQACIGSVAPLEENQVLIPLESKPPEADRDLTTPATSEEIAGLMTIWQPTIATPENLVSMPLTTPQLLKSIERQARGKADLILAFQQQDHAKIANGKAFFGKSMPKHLWLLNDTASLEAQTFMMEAFIAVAIATKQLRGAVVTRKHWAFAALAQSALLSAIGTLMGLPATDCVGMDESQVALFDLVYAETKKRRIYLTHLKLENTASQQDLRTAIQALNTQPVITPDLASPELEGEISDCVELQTFKHLLEGQRMVMVGGDPDTVRIKQLEAVLGIKVFWVDSASHQSITKFEAAIAHPKTKIVLLLTRWASHSYAGIKDYCKTYNKHFVQLPGGINHKQVIHHVLSQIGQRLSAAA